MLKKKNISSKLYILLFPILSHIAYGQYTLSGKIIDNSNNAIPKAEIYNISTDKQYFSNSDGTYYISFNKKGSYNLVFTAENHGLVEENINIYGDIKRNIILSRMVRLSEVALVAQKEKLSIFRRMKDVEGTSIYAGKKTEVIMLNYTKPNLSSGTQRQLFSQIAGLNIYENNQASVQLNIGGRGLNPNRTSNFNTRQNEYGISADALGYPENYYTPPAEALQEIQFVRGAASLQYGTQFGGLINFKTKDPPKYKKISLNSRQTIGSFGLFSSFNSIGGTIGNFNYYTYFNYKEGKGFRPNSPFTSSNFFGQFNYNISEKSTLSIETTTFHYLAQQAGGLTDAQFYKNIRYSNRTRNWFEVQWFLYNIKFKHNFSKDTKLSINIFGLNANRKSVGFIGNQSNQNANAITDVDEQRLDGTYVYPRDVIFGAFSNIGGEIKLLHKYNIKNKKTIALIGTKLYNSTNTSSQGAGSLSTDADFKIYHNKFPDYSNQSSFVFPNKNIAFFGENIFYLKNKLSITPGFRYDYIKTGTKGDYRQVLFDLAGNSIANTQKEEEKTLARHIFLLGLGVSYKPFLWLELYGNLSQNYRSITFSDIRTISPTFKIDPNIKDESGSTLDIGIRGKLNNILSYDTNVFSIFYNHKIGIILDNRANRVRTNVGNAIIYGIESLLSWNIDRLINLPNKYKCQVFTNLAITKSQYYQSKIIGIKGNQLEFIPMWNFKTGINYGYKNIIGNIQYSLLSEQFTEATNAKQNKEDTTGGIIGSVPSYEILDVSICYKYKWMRLELGVNNLLDSHYFTQRATSYPGPGIIPSQVRNFYMTLGVSF